MLSEVLFKLKEVYKFIKPILIAYNISQQNSIKIILYFLIYERTARLSIKKEVLIKNTLLDGIITLIYKLPLFRESIRIVIKRA